MTAEPSLKYPPLTDLRPICRNHERTRTTVLLYDAEAMRWADWLILGAVQMMPPNNSDNAWTFGCYLDKGATDYEEDSAYAARFPIWSPTIKMVRDSYTLIEATISAEEPEGRFCDFHVPLPGYNPLKHKDTKTCTKCETHHPLVPPGMYVPPTDRQLYEAVRGRRIQISILQLGDENES